MFYMDIPVSYDYIPVEQYGEQYKVSQKEADKLYALEERINEDPSFNYEDREKVLEILNNRKKVQELAERYRSVHTWDQMRDLVKNHYGAGGFKKKPLGKKLKFSEQEYAYARNERVKEERREERRIEIQRENVRNAFEAMGQLEERHIESELEEVKKAFEAMGPLEELRKEREQEELRRRWEIAYQELGECLQQQTNAMQLLIEKLSDIKYYVDKNLNRPSGNDIKIALPPETFWGVDMLQDLRKYSSEFTKQFKNFKNTVLEIFNKEDGTAWAQYQALKDEGFPIQKVQDFQATLFRGWQRGSEFGVDMPQLVTKLLSIHGSLCGITQILEKKIARLLLAPMRDAFKSNLFYNAFPACIERVENFLFYQYRVEFSPYVPYESESDND